MSPQLSSNEFSTITTGQNHTTGAGNENLGIDLLDAYTQPAIENIWPETNLAELVPDNGNGGFRGSDTTQILDSWALSPQSSSSECLAVEKDHSTFVELTQPAIEDFSWIEQCVADMSHVPNELLTPFVHVSDECFCPAYDVDLWTQNNSHDEHV